MEVVTTNYLDISIDTKLKILRMLDKKQVLRCRLVSKDFVPRELQVGLILVHRVPHPDDLAGIYDGISVEWTPLEYRATVVLDLSAMGKAAAANSEPQRQASLTFRLNFGCDHRYIIQDKHFANLTEAFIPYTLLNKTKRIFMFGTAIRPIDVDMIAAHCQNLERIAMIEISPEIAEKMAAVCLNNRDTLTHVGVSDLFVDSNVAVDCGLLQKQAWLCCFDCGNLPPINPNFLPSGVTSLMIYSPVMIQDLVDVAVRDPTRFDRLEQITLVVDEWRKSVHGVYQVVTEDMLRNLCNFPRLTELTLKFPLKMGGQVYTRQLVNRRLKPMLARVREAEGITGEILTNGVYFSNKMQMNVYTFQARIERNKFTGL